MNDKFEEKGQEALPRGKIEKKRYRNYYDVSGSITTAGASNPNDFESNVYNRERVFEILERYADAIQVSNDGTDTLFVIVSHGGTTGFTGEAPVYPGENKIYYNVYELRLRSPTSGNRYRVTEYDICCNNEVIFIPIEKANLHNQTLPGIGTIWLTNDIIPTHTPSTLRIEVAVSVAGNFSARITKSGNSQVVTFNAVAGPALVAGGVYIFDLLVHSGDSVNFQYSATGGTIQILRVQEIDAGTS